MRSANKHASDARGIPPGRGPYDVACGDVMINSTKPGYVGLGLVVTILKGSSAIFPPLSPGNNYVIFPLTTGYKQPPPPPPQKKSYKLTIQIKNDKLSNK